ncbi:MAG: caspase family protein [Methylobacteriaceae bacterium]|nr:caspase family protein [Methylobacteriaceae bacterium]
MSGGRRHIRQGGPQADAVTPIRRLAEFLATIALAVGLWAFAAAGAQAERRVALVIGNSSYKKVAALPNPGNDASDVAAVLRGLDFDVINVIDADQIGFNRALGEFSRKAIDADAALFFYAGHGVQLRGQNYLLPVDADAKDEVSAEFEFVALERVRQALDRAAPSAVRILILDACRDNPLARTAALTRGVQATRGLARIDLETVGGMIVVYATQANQVAQDGTERNSPFTSALLARLKEPGLEVGALFRRVTNDVRQKTQGKQIPELSISLGQDYYLNRNETDSIAFDRIADSGDPQDFRAFLERYPGSSRGPRARRSVGMMVRDKARRRHATQQREAEAREAAARAAEAEARQRREEAARREADADRARQEAARREAERRQAEAAARLAAEREQAATAARQQADAARLAAEREQAETAARLAAERARLEATQLAERRQQEAARRYAERRQAEAEARLAAERQQSEAAERQQAEAAAQARREAERLEQIRLAEAQAARQRAEAAAETARLAEAERRRSEQAAAAPPAVAPAPAAEAAPPAPAAPLTEADRRRQEEDRRTAELIAAQARAQESMRLAQQPPAPGGRSAVAVATLGAAPAAPEAADTPELIRAAQGELKRLRCYAGALDGKASKATRAALAAYAGRAGGAADAPVTAALIEAMRAQRNPVCGRR